MRAFISVALDSNNLKLEEALVLCICRELMRRKLGSKLPLH